MRSQDNELLETCCAWIRHQPVPVSTNPLQALIGIDMHLGHLPDTALHAVSQCFHMTVGEVRALKSFYSFLEFSTPHRWRVLLSDTPIDVHRGQQAIQQTLIERCRHDEGIVIGTTSCIGWADHPVAALINGQPCVSLTPHNIDRLVERLLNSEDGPIEGALPVTRMLHAGPLASPAPKPGAALHRAQHIGANATVEGLRQAGLTGRGGAAYPTADKWQAVREATDITRYIVCNADEGEPGTFKDRWLLEQHTDTLIEGMILAGWCCGAREGVIYLRGEYRYLKPLVERALHRFRMEGRLGHTAAPDFDITVYMGAGAYVCGEETALLESIEGRRGIPRIRPPWPTTAGLYGHPTVVNNVETFVRATRITASDDEAYRRALGESVLWSVAGDCPQAGIGEWPLQTPLPQLLRDIDAPSNAWVQLGGPSGEWRAGRSLEVPVGHAGGAFTVFGNQRDPLAIATQYSRFFAHESCGFCTPCRAGSAQLEHLLSGMSTGDRDPNAVTNIRRLLDVTALTSHCGLGQRLGQPVRGLLAHFPERLS